MAVRWILIYFGGFDFAMWMILDVGFVRFAVYAGSFDLFWVIGLLTCVVLRVCFELRLRWWLFCVTNLLVDGLVVGLL